ncbi:MAG TPA: phosphoglucosamine mutase, partial [Trueperaceae bacterium]
GHILLLDKAPTGDGMLSALQVLAAVRKSGRPLEAWMDDLPMYPQTLVNVQVTPEAKQSAAEHPKVRAAVKDAETKLGADGRINLRPSGTEPLVRVMVEGPEQAMIEDLAQEIAQAVKKAGH